MNSELSTNIFYIQECSSDWGLNRFAETEYEESMDEMRHADKLIQRILFLEGLPSMEYMGSVYIAKMLSIFFIVI